MNMPPSACAPACAIAVISKADTLDRAAVFTREPTKNYFRSQDMSPASAKMMWICSSRVGGECRQTANLHRKPQHCALRPCAADLDRNVVLRVRDSKSVGQARAALVPLALGGARQRQRLLPLRQDDGAAAPAARAPHCAADERRHGAAAHSTRTMLSMFIPRLLELCARYAYAQKQSQNNDDL